MEGSGPSIDELLRQSFLELDQASPANDQLFDAASQHVFSQNWTSGKVHVSASKRTAFYRLPWVWGLSSALIFSGIATLIYLLQFNTEEGDKISTATNQNKINNVSSSSNTNSNLKTNDYEQTTESKSANDYFTGTYVENKKIKSGTVKFTKSELKNGIQINLNSSLSDSAAHGSLLLSESDNKETVLSAKKIVISDEVQKRTFVKQEREKLAAKITTEITQRLPLIPGAQGPYNDKTFQVPFYMWPTEVTVGEYNVFLLDLLLQGREDEYETARPHLDGSFGTLLSEHDKDFFERYLTGKEFSDYPIVFISPEGANLYCKWMQEVISASAEASRSIIVRLPNKGEWERAAAGGRPHIEYGTFSGTIKSGILHHRFEANFKETQQNDFDFLLGQHSETVTNGHIKTHKGELNTFTTKAGIYPANPYMLYDMAGNVSEMVVDRKGHFSVKGGNWNSSSEFLRIRDNDFTEFPLGIIPCPFIGFRPVININ